MKHSNQKAQKGFTLIELMIVVAIIGVLSAIAIPAYKDYVSKSEAASGLATIKALQTPAELFFQENGTTSAPALDTALGTTTGANALGLITATKSTIVFTFGANSSLNGKTLTLTRDATTGWTCAAAADVPALDGCS